MAILSVLIFHYLAEQGLAARPSITFYLQRLTMMGGTGVDLFFVLSGFLIGGILLDVRESPRFFSTFYARRLFRIFPLYYAWIGSYIVLTTFAFSAIRAHSTSDSIPTVGFPVYAHFLFIQNIWLITFSGLAGSWFAHLWSLAVEEQFYLVCPLVVRFFSRENLYRFLLTVIVSTPIWRILFRQLLHPPNPWILSIFTPFRADTLAIGVLAALLWREKRVQTWLADDRWTLQSLWWILLAGAVALWRWSPQSGTYGMQYIGFTWLALFYASTMVVALARHDSWIAMLARTRWLRSLGAVSYCVYVIHLAVNSICHAILLHRSPRTTDWQGTTVTLAAAFLTYALARTSWRIFESPLLRRGHSFKY
jgi:peptidoglycan/LPS O-acetylase OafA/YrhL